MLKRYGLSAVPTGLARYSDFWSHSLFPGYDFERSGHPTFGYYASAAIGTVAHRSRRHRPLRRAPPRPTPLRPPAMTWTPSRTAASTP